MGYLGQYPPRQPGLNVGCKQEKDVFDVMIDKATAGVRLEGMDDVPGLWPQASQRVLTKSEIDDMPTDSLRMMGAEIYLRHSRLSDLRISEELMDQLKAQSWYMTGWRFEESALTDVEEQNYNLISELICRRERK